MNAQDLYEYLDALTKEEREELALIMDVLSFTTGVQCEAPVVTCKTDRKNKVLWLVYK